VLGITVMGFDIGEHFPQLEDVITDFVLDKFSGSVGLVVDRDGETLEIDLE
jgi:hypothetical protein